MNTMGLFKFKEMTSTEMPKIKEDNTKSEDRKKANHQRKDFIKTYDIDEAWCGILNRQGNIYA